MLALDGLSGCKADVRRLCRTPVSFDSAIACDHFKIILILPIGIETFYSRCAAKTDLVTPILLGQIESPIGHRLQRFKLILPRSSLALTPNEALTRSVTLLCKKTSRPWIRWRNRSATAAASCRVVFGITIQNSSPPTLPSRSPCRTALDSVLATIDSTLSPA